MRLVIPANSMEIESHIREAILDYYKHYGLSFDVKASYDTSCALKGYLVSLRKTIMPRKRKVYISRELLQKTNSADFEAWRQRFDDLKSWFENGSDIRPYLSKHYRQSTFQDKLLNCWKMHHIHFNPNVKSGDMLLFAMVYDEAAYFIDVLPHNKKAVFSTYNLLNIVYDNWKELLAPYEVKGAKNVINPITTDEDIEKVRKAGLTTFIKVRDERLSERITAIQKEKEDKEYRAKRISLFIRMLAAQKECLEFDAALFTAFVERVVVSGTKKDVRLTYVMRDGEEYIYGVR